MELPQDLLNSTLIKEKAVFYFSSEHLNTSEPHNFILVKNIDDKFIVFSCCTSQYNTIYNYIKRNDYSEETMTSLDYNEYEFLKKPTFINCNSKIEYTYSEFSDLYQKGRIKHKGEIKDSDYNAIVNGILLSEDIEEEFKDYFR